MYQRLYHPLSGKCVRADENYNLQASECTNLSKWNHSGDGTPVFLVGGTDTVCLTSVGEGMEVLLTSGCPYQDISLWTSVSNYQLATTNGLCLHYEPGNDSKIITKQCICVNCADQNPQAQWFKFIPTNVEY